MTTVFAVFRQGCYRHECGGVFSTKEAAVAGAKACAAADVDSYHVYEVVPFELDAATPTSDRPTFMMSPDLQEVLPVFTCVKDSADQSAPA